jgi:cell division septation protein DedD
LIVQKALGDPLDLQTRIGHVRRLAALPPDDASKVLTALRKPAAVATPAPVAPATQPAKTVSEHPSTPPPKPAEKSIAERHDELKKVYADLIVRREALQEGDAAALAAYTRDTARYVEQLAQLQKDSDALKK